MPDSDFIILYIHRTLEVCVRCLQPLYDNRSWGWWPVGRNSSFIWLFWCSVICSTYLRGQPGSALCPGCEASVVILVSSVCRSWMGGSWIQMSFFGSSDSLLKVFRVNSCSGQTSDPLRGGRAVWYAYDTSTYHFCHFVKRTKKKNHVWHTSINES